MQRFEINKIKDGYNSLIVDEAGRDEHDGMGVMIG